MPANISETIKLSKTECDLLILEETKKNVELVKYNLLKSMIKKE